MKLLITGSKGFLGWHLRCQLKAKGVNFFNEVGRTNWGEINNLIAANDYVIHLAAINRSTQADLINENRFITDTLVTAINLNQRPIFFVNANSIHSEGESIFGEMKSKSADSLKFAVESNGGIFVDVVIPNVFGEHGQPDYHSFVASFARDIWKDTKPPRIDTAEVELVHASEVTDCLISSLNLEKSSQFRMSGKVETPQSIFETMKIFWQEYRTGKIPFLDSDFHVRLFNSFRSLQDNIGNPLNIESFKDQRGSLHTVVKSSSEGQTFISTSKPGIFRGQHFHMDKIERFSVIQGTAEIQMRKLFTSDVKSFRVTGHDPISIDMPTLWAHSIENIGSEDLITMFWTKQEFDESNSDTFIERVQLEDVNHESNDGCWN